MELMVENLPQPTATTGGWSKITLILISVLYYLVNSEQCFSATCSLSFYHYFCLSRAMRVMNHSRMDGSGSLSHHLSISALGGLPSFIILAYLDPITNTLL